MCVQASESNQQTAHQLSLADAETELARIGKQIQVSRPNHCRCTNLMLTALFTLSETLGAPGQAGAICKETKRGVSQLCLQDVGAR